MSFVNNYREISTSEMITYESFSGILGKGNVYIFRTLLTHAYHLVFDNAHLCSNNERSSSTCSGVAFTGARGNHATQKCFCPVF